MGDKPVKVCVVIECEEKVSWHRGLTSLKLINLLKTETLSGRQKNILQFSPKFPQFCTDLRGIQIRWNFCEIFFRFKDMAFYLVLDFFNSAQTYYI